jgi:hypothetical protein
MGRSYFFLGMLKMVKEIVLGCDVCNKTRTARHALYGTLKNPAVPEIAWKSII